MLSGISEPGVIRKPEARTVFGPGRQGGALVVAAFQTVA
jgi:hypothetical protein